MIRPARISKLTQDTKLTRQAVTKHLQVLAQAHIVSSTRAGRETRFAFNPAPIEDIKKYLQIVSAQWDDALSRPRTFVER